jgi:hypothetical protein
MPSDRFTTRPYEVHTATCSAAKARVVLRCEPACTLQDERAPAWTRKLM